MLLFASPFTAHLNISPKLSQMFVVDEAAVQEDLIEFKVVPDLKQEFVDEKNDPVLFWATDSASGATRGSARIAGILR